jgi:hypothetical protein
MTRSTANLRRQLIERLEKLGIEYHLLPDRDDAFASLSFGGKAFAHFHNDGKLDIRLTRAVIEREGLVHPAGSVVHPDRTQKSPWIEIRFTKPAHLERVVRLVKLAIEQI